MLVGLAGLTTALAAGAFTDLLVADGWNLIDFPILLLFVILYFWISIGFWTATFGFVWSLVHGEPALTGEPPPRRSGPAAPLPPTAIVMPIYNEDPRRAFANLQAVRDSLRQAGQDTAFDIFVLSDTRDADIWAEEECTWARMRAAGDGHGPFYRRRPMNIGRKSGNIQDFCQRWGARYRYMVILDADSLMTGDTLVEMVRRMEDDPELGILQVPPVLVNRDSFFARLLQFSSALYGNVFRSGFTVWARSEGNYWGHNAILRVQPFMRCCGLPRLPGKPPWGGEILSHDFVEAALMLGAGWKVMLAADLGGSYEECPTNLIDFAKRDERWSQGNLQHLPLVIAAGIHPVSRFHLGVGAMSYLASPLWALFLLLSLVQGIGWQIARRAAEASPDRGELSPAVAMMPLFGALALLLLVKVWGLLAAFARPSTAARFGKPLKLVLSVLLETVVSCLVAPILMAFHTTFVINALLGRRVEWRPQPRGENVPSFAETFRVHSPHTIVGLAAALLLTWTETGLFWWMLPILLGLVFSVPLSLLLSSVRVGRSLRAAGLMLIPEEASRPPIVKLQHRYLAAAGSDCAACPHPFVRLVADPRVLRLHLALLPEAAPSPLSASMRDRLQRIALSGGPSHITRAERLLLMQDLAALQWLHREVWKDWPIELLEKGTAACRHRPRVIGL